jgi:hypothetical protein
MRKIIALALFLSSVLAISAGEIEKTYSFGNPEISVSGKFQILNLQNTMITGKSGEPALPYHTVQLLLPPGERAVSIEFIGEDEILLDGEFNIYPQQASIPLSQPESGKFLYNELIYKSNSFYPSIQTGELLTQFLNGYAFALSSFTPMRYNPVTGEVFMYRKVKIRIVTESSSQSEEALKNLGSGERIIEKIKSFSQNSEMILQYSEPKASADDYDMLIITTSQFENNFQDLIDFYMQKGIKTNVASMENINTDMSGLDSADKLRNFIKQEYQNHNIGYVLLGGDVEHVPFRGFYCYVQSGDGYEDYGIPSDLYYAALDGNWNNNSDLLWAEPGEEDLLPEIAIGRFSFSDISELNIMLHKTISYQNSPVLGEFNNTLLAGELLMEEPLTHGSDYLELLIGHITENGYETFAIPETYNFQKLYDEVEYWDAGTLIAAINLGKQYVHHLGHANYDYVAYMYNADITNENFSEVDGINHNYTIFHTEGCMCGGFDTEDCILERMVCIDNFAVAVIGNSRYGWFNEGQTDGPAIHLHREMMDALYHHQLYNIGDAFMEAKIQTAPWVTAPGQWEEGALRWNIYDINILGDPMLAIWTAEPISVEADYENILHLDALSTNVTVTASSLPVANLTCVIMKNGVIHGVGVTDASGNAVITIEPAFTEIGSAQLIISGNNCKPTSFPISVETNIAVNQFGVSEFSIYPNPAKDLVNISVPDEFVNDGQILIVNQEGKTVYQQQISNKIISIDISKFRSSYYVVKVSNKAKSISLDFEKI